MTSQARFSPAQAEDITRQLLDGRGTQTLATVYGKSTGWVWNVATLNGLIYDKTTRRWIRKEDQTVTNGEWNMSTEDYEALLTPEREHTNGDGATPEPAAADLPSIDDDIKEALDLLARAEQQRKDDIKAIEQLHRQLADAERITANISDKADKLRSEKSTLETRVAQLETENKRLMDKLKGEISRGLLRQGMDSLRKVL